MPTDDELGETYCAERRADDAADVDEAEPMTMLNVPVAVEPPDAGTVAAIGTAAVDGDAEEPPPEHADNEPAAVTAAMSASANFIIKFLRPCAHDRTR